MTLMQEAQDKIHAEAMARELAPVWDGIPGGGLVEFYRRFWNEMQTKRGRTGEKKAD